MKLQPSDLVEPAADERVLGAAAQRAARGVEAPAGAAPRGQRGRQLVEAPDARDLLDQVGLAGDVAAAPVRHGDVEAAGRAAHAEAERAQDRALLGQLGTGAEQLRDARVAQVDRRRGGGARPPTSIVPADAAARRQSSGISARGDGLRLDASARAAAPSRSAPEASVRRPSRVEVRWMFGPFQVAASISTRVVSSGRPPSARRP